MRMTLLLFPLLAANAYAGDSAVALQAQPLVQKLAPSPAGRPGIKAAAESRAVVGPKIHEMVATRNDDGSLNVGCVERPNPRAGKSRVNTVAPENQQ